MGSIQPAQLPEPFSPREVEILRLIKEGLTNQEIARALFLSLDTIKWYNKQIYGKLGVNNRTRAVERAGHFGLIDLKGIAPAREPTHVAHNLPAPLSSFIGRKTELAELRHLLQTEQIRLVTLAGPGGVGKTSTAIQVGWELQRDFADGVFFFALAAIREVRLVIPTIAAAFNLHEIPGKTHAELLREYLANKRLLLILDNFEQVLQAGPQVCDLLRAAPGVKALVTSREILRLSGEQVYPLPPLSLPLACDSLSFNEIENNEAVQLFVMRAHGLQPDFCLEADNAPTVMGICCKLDGLPLAIELAAARICLFTPQEMLAHLDHRLSLLVGGMRDSPARQQTMRASIEWSHALLSPDEQVLFRRLAVFSGGCTLEAAQAVCGEPVLEVIGGIESLLDKYLLQRSVKGGETRLGMFETVREFALECLEWSGEDALIHRKHADYYADWEERHYQELNLLDTEIENFRAAMRWSIDSGQATPGLLIPANTWFWSKRNVEVQSWMDELLASPGAQDPSPEKEDLVWHAFLQDMHVQDFVRCQAFADQYMALARAQGNKIAEIRYPYLAGYLCIGAGDYEGAVDQFSEGLAAWKDSGKLFWIGIYQIALGVSLLLLHNYDRAEAALMVGLEAIIKIEFQLIISEVYSSLGYLALEKGELPRSREYFSKAIDQAIAVGFEAGLPDILNGLASMAVQQDQWARAARLYGASQELSIRTGCLTHEPPLFIISQRYQEALRLHLNSAILESLWQEGRQMTKDEALTYGLADSPGPFTSGYILCS